MLDLRPLNPSLDIEPFVPKIVESPTLDLKPLESTEQPFSMFKETMRNLPSAIGQTMLQAPIQTLTEGVKMQNEAIEAGKWGAIKNAYDTISGLLEYGEKQLLKLEPMSQDEFKSGIPKVDEFISNLSLKAKQKFLQSSYVKQKERIMKKHPIATKIGGFVPDVGLLVAASATPTPTDDAAIIVRLATKYPKIALAIKSAARSGKVLGIFGFTKELSKTQNLPSAVKEGLKSGAFGALVFGAGGSLENPYVRNTLQTAGAGTWSLLTSLHERHKKGESLTKQDFLDAGLSAGMILALGLITTPQHQRSIAKQKVQYATKGLGEIQKKGYKVQGTLQEEGITKKPLSKLYQFWAKTKGLSQKHLDLKLNMSKISDSGLINNPNILQLIRH